MKKSVFEDMDWLNELSETLTGPRPHMHPPAFERCVCSNTSRLRILLKPERAPDGRPETR